VYSARLGELSRVRRRRARPDRRRWRRVAAHERHEMLADLRLENEREEAAHLRECGEHLLEMCDMSHGTMVVKLKPNLVVTKRAVTVKLQLQKTTKNVLAIACLQKRASRWRRLFVSKPFRATFAAFICMCAFPVFKMAPTLLPLRMTLSVRRLTASMTIHMRFLTIMFWMSAL